MDHLAATAPDEAPTGEGMTRGKKQRVLDFSMNAYDWIIKD